MKRHWYFIVRYFCVLCGHSTEYRERRYGAKPSDSSKRSEYIETACGYHFA